MQKTSNIQLRELAVAWAERFASCVRAKDIDQASGLFSPFVHSYGTRAVEVHGLERLQHEQWHPTWYRTRDFRHLPGSIDVQLSADASIAVICARWSSYGVDSPESWGTQVPYARTGRCTYILNLAEDGDWVCSHTHFSLDPGT